MDNPAPAEPEQKFRRPTATTPPAVPSISDYWPDAPHRIGPPADHYTDGPTESAVDALRRSGTRDSRQPGAPVPPPVRRKPRRTALVALPLAALLMVGAGYVGIRLTRHTDREPVAALPGPALPLETGPTPAPDPPVVVQTTKPPSPTTSASPTRSSANAVRAPAGNRRKASFELASNTAVIDLRAADTGGDLYRITTPANGAVRPRAQVNEAGVKLFLDKTGKRGEAGVTVLLNAKVRWSMRINGGVRTGVFDLGGAEVDGLNFAGDAARIDLTLPRPDGTLPIRLSGGVNRFEVNTAQGVPVRVRTRGGAGQVKLDGRTDDGVARGSSFLSPDWAKSVNRIDLDAVAGVGTLRVGPG